MGTSKLKFFRSNLATTWANIVKFEQIFNWDIGFLGLLNQLLKFKNTYLYFVLCFIYLVKKNKNKSGEFKMTHQATALAPVVSSILC